MLQKSFPLAPIYEPNSLSEYASEKSFIENEYPKFDSLCKQTVGQPFSVLANRQPDKLGLRNTNWGEPKRAPHLRIDRLPT